MIVFDDKSSLYVDRPIGIATPAGANSRLTFLQYIAGVNQQDSDGNPIGGGGSGPNWPQLLWGIPNLFTFAAGTATFTPDSTQSSSFDSRAGSVAPPPNPNFQNANNSATLTYNGVAFNCILTATFTIPVGGTAAGSLSISSAINGALLAVSSSSYGNGTFNIPFVVPSTGGVNDTITVAASTSNDQDSPGIMIFLGNIANA